MNNTCNILLLGKTGVGKSALLNYLAGKTLAESGVPETGGGLTRGIHKYPIAINGYNCIVADSEGLEAGASKEWNNIIDNALMTATSSDKPADWYHIVVFCISAAGGRVEDIEAQTINKLKNAGYGVIIAFTKSDVSSEDDTKEMRNRISELIPNGNFKYIDVSSVQLRGGYKFGKEELSDAIIKQWGKTVVNMMPNYVFDWCNEYLTQQESKIKDWVWSQNMRVFGRSAEDVIHDVNKKIEATVNTISTEVTKRQRIAFAEISEVMAAFSKILRIQTNSTFSNIDSMFEKVRKESDSPTSAGEIVGIILLFPILFVPALFATLLDDGSKEKRKICKNISENLSKTKTKIAEQKNILKEKLEKIYGDS